MSKFEDLFRKEEELHPDLQPYLERSDKLGYCLKHPLVFSIMHSSPLNAMINQQYSYKKEAVEKALKNKNWGTYLFLHERPYRITKFAEIRENLSNEEYWKLLGEVWIDSENLWQYKYLLKDLLGSTRPNRNKIMDEDELEFFKKLPDEFMIFRGHQSKNKDGYSWTLSYWKAHWFADRWQQGKSSLLQAKVKKEDIIAVLFGRGEFEVIALHENFKKQSVKPLQRLDWMNHVLELAKDGYQLSQKSHHGYWHWEKVEKNALILAKHTPNADPVVAQLFSIIHDAKRINEQEDDKHGTRAAQWAAELFQSKKLEISQDQLSKLMEACMWHDAGDISDDPTIGVCWDADRLDLMRVGIIPEEKYLSTQAGKQLLWKI